MKNNHYESGVAAKTEAAALTSSKRSRAIMHNLILLIILSFSTAVIIQALCFAYGIYETRQIELYGAVPQTPLRALYTFLCILVPIFTAIIYFEHRTAILPLKNAVSLKSLPPKISKKPVLQPATPSPAFQATLRPM